jgi:phytoene dehydrogenase-like protein
MAEAVKTRLTTAATDPPIVIIGAGLAGLSCGCYLQMNGYRTEILETNKDPGGLCVAWDRGPYVFDGCLRWLAGTHPGSNFNQMWTELGALDGRAIVNYPEFLRVEGTDGRVLALSTDIEQLAADFKRISPPDAALVDQLIRAARRCAPLEPPLKAIEVMSGSEKLKLLFEYFPMLPVIFKWKNATIAQYVARYRNPFLREVLLASAGDSRMSALVLVMVLAIRAGKNAGYVSGGSRGLSGAIANRYNALGGQIHYDRHAVAIIVENRRATAVRCADGALLPAATVISCADGYTTIFKMLAGRFVPRRLHRAYEALEVFPGMIQASLGISRAFSDAPPTLSVPLPRPLVPDGAQTDRLEVSVYGHDSGFCQPGKSVMIVRFATRYDYWVKLKNETPGEYRKAKLRLVHDLVEILDLRFPGTAGNVECSDLATPASFERWTGNWQGSYQGWLPTPRVLTRRFPYTLSGLSHFYMAGHWVQPGGGLPPAALSGRYVAQMICARDGKRFEIAEVEPAQ